MAATRSPRLSPALVGGRIEQRELGLHGVPVRGAYETVRIAPDGSTERLAAIYPEAAPQLRPSEARISAAAVPGLVAAARGMADEPELEAPPELVYILVLGQPVLAWETQLALRWLPEPSRPTVWVSAATGRLLREEEQVRSSRARIFPQNPSNTPEAVEVELYDIHVEDAGHPLVGSRIQAFNCVGEETEEVSPWWSEEECWPLQTVFSNEDGDYFVHVPNVVLVEDNVALSDPYAELSMYAHGEIFLEAMKARGIEQFKCELSSMLANVHSYPADSPDPSPLNNAYYTNQCDPERGPTMMFGQGSDVDFGYDADVIYHELGHGMVALLTPDNLGGRRLREDAALVDAGAINEAVADYFSVMLTDEPHLADYVGRFWSGSGEPYIRNAENDKTCPSDSIGQVHNDGEPFMAAMWATRKRLDDGGKDALDQVLLRALMRMPRDCTLEEASALVLEEAELAVLRSTLHDVDVDLLRRSFDARGLLDCPRVVTDPELVRSGKTMFLRRFDDAVYPYYPGPLQLRYEVPPGADDMVVRFRLRPRGSDDPVEARVLVKRGDAPIHWEYQLVAVDDPPLEGDDGGSQDDPVRELVLVEGDWDVELTPQELTEQGYEARLGGLEPGEVLHVTLVDLARTEAIASEVKVHASTELPDDGEDETDTGGGEASTGELPALDEVPPGGGQAGCACRAEGGSRGPGGALGLAVLVAAAGRRRRRWAR
ncbi:MAG: MYXO-CTERM sorting domain-containing protein [Myxococcales bacterium]|nr:MYXO-CTERM sorting domain-containing protein [Myxococcales bacterium]